MKKIIITYIVFLSTAFAQDKPLSLEESLQIGLKNSKEIKIAESKVIGSEEKITEVGAQMFPKLTLGAGYTNLNVVKPETFGLVPGNPAQIENPFYSYGLNLSLQAPIFTGFQLSSLKSAAEFNNKAIQNELEKTINQKALGIHSAFWNLYKAEKSVEIILQGLSSLQQKLLDTEQFLENGLATKNDLLKLKVQVSNINLNLIDAKNKQEVARAILNKAIGYSLNEQTKIETDVMLNPLSEYNYDELLSEALINREELKSLGYRIEAGEEYITAANSGWWPKLYAVGSYYYYKLNAETFNISDQNLQLWYLGLSLSWDLWDWGYTSSKSTQAEQEVLQSRETRNLLKEQIELEVYNNYLSLISEKEKINISNLAIESAEENYRITEDKYNNQLATSTDLIIAQTELLDAKTQHAISIADYKLAVVMLEMAAGRRIY